MSTPPRPTVVPPMPKQAPPTPAESVQQRVQQRAADRRAAEKRQADARRAERTRARDQRTVQRSRSTHREKTRNRTLNININKGGPAAPGVGSGAGTAAGGTEAGTPGAGFMSNEDIRAFSEYVRKQARNRAVERSMDHEHLYQVLRHIPDANGSKSGSRARARRVARYLRAIAACEKLIARNAAGIYRAFEAEFESELSKVGKARSKDAKPRQPFKFG